MKSNEENGLDDLISEIISENKGRGRPAKHTQKDYEQFARWPAKTPRGQQNYIFALRAVSVLEKDPERFAYLLGQKCRHTVLAELGRINPEWRMVSVASDICRMRMNRAKAIGLCRRMRGKGSPEAGSLAKQIRRTIQDYRDGHPNFSDADVARALSMAAYE